MKTLLKNNIWIESLNHKDWTLYDEYIDLVIYSGKVSDIPDECIQECIDECTDYQTGNGDLLAVKESILSACDQEYCVIYRNNVNNIDSLYGLYSPEGELMFAHKTREGACKSRDEYEKIIQDGEVTPEQMEEFLKSRIADYDQMVQKIVDDFKIEMIAAGNK